jgi:hypothetical protein
VLGLCHWVVKIRALRDRRPERWFNIPYGRGMIHFFHPGLVKSAGVSTFMCQGNEAAGSVFACEPIGKTALDLGIITSLDIVHSADR